jgi:hypothetical protein
MQRVTPYFANGCPKICWGCGNPFVVRDGHAEAILAPDNRLYCYGTACADQTFALHVTALKRVA